VSYCREGSVSSTRASTDSDLEGDLSSASTKLELLILLVGARDFSVLFECGFGCIIQLILRDYRVSASRCCLFRSSLLRMIKIIKRPGSFVFSLLVVLFYSINIRGS
jgi:hypothetical protein